MISQLQKLTTIVEFETGLVWSKAFYLPHIWVETKKINQSEDWIGARSDNL